MAQVMGSTDIVAVDTVPTACDGRINRVAVQATSRVGWLIVTIGHQGTRADAGLGMTKPLDHRGEDWEPTIKGPGTDVELDPTSTNYFTLSPDNRGKGYKQRAVDAAGCARALERCRSYWNEGQVAVSPGDIEKPTAWVSVTTEAMALVLPPTNRIRRQ